ncbi:response regulator [Deinococcus yavapaiensis]|uniref:Two-component system response regulator/twitching motility two-component system response regulator PilH n=1 Tax=Deinococcus yavapaiensis KR-236 TaxID=694435 RepID=A0A318S5Z6_9DEIO|nr:response regulator [Deinococcus yavapaiensis]PYE49433.1 two-component system response regulator/twitching motility two-component system response regulator PilH [Deinococcus yavapaiensis KR-236]
MAKQPPFHPRLLVIDDNNRDAKLVVEGFREVRPDAIVATAINGSDGLETARRELPDLILLDLVFPSESGLDILQTLKRDEIAKRIPIVVLSGHPRDDLVWSAYHEYAAAFLLKPPTFDELLQMLRVIADFWFSSARLIGSSRALLQAPRQD